MPKIFRGISFCVADPAYLLFVEFWYTTALSRLVKVHQKVHKFATKYPKLATILRYLCKKVGLKKAHYRR